MKYTKSVDGKMRLSRHIVLRFTKEQWRELDQKAKALGYKSYFNYAEDKALNAVMSLDDDYAEHIEFEERMADLR